MLLKQVINLQKMSWNHRILAHEQNGEIYLQIHEVYYDKSGKPNGYTANPVTIGGENLKSITWTLNKILQCRNKPILWAGDKFPNGFAEVGGQFLKTSQTKKNQKSTEQLLLKHAVSKSLPKYSKKMDGHSEHCKCDGCRLLESIFGNVC